jgi:hypothetical protein
MQLRRIKGILLLDGNAYKEIYEDHKEFMPAFFLASIIYLIVTVSLFHVDRLNDTNAGYGVGCDLNVINIFKENTSKIFPAPLLCSGSLGGNYKGDKGPDSFLPTLLLGSLMGVVYMLPIYLIILWILVRLLGGRIRNAEGFITVIFYSQIPSILGTIGVLGEPYKGLGLGIGFVWTLLCITKATKETAGLSNIKAGFAIIFMTFLFGFRFP